MTTFCFIGVDVAYENGLPVLTVPLPSRRERCQFTLKPVNNNLDDFICFLEQEDGGIDRVAAYKSGKLLIFSCKRN